MQLGLNFLDEEFGITPQIAWQIDQFGHSAAQTYLFSLMNYTALFLSRVDFEEKQRRINNTEMVFNWRTEINNSTLLTYMFPSLYSPIGKFNTVHMIN